MKRYRTFNASPARTSSATVAIITDVIKASLAAAPGVDDTDVNSAMATAEPALLMLVSSRSLTTTPLVLVAGSTELEITCRYDAAAVGGEENLNPVSGMASTKSFAIHFPTPDPIGTTIEELTASHPALTTDPLSLKPKPAAALATSGEAPLNLAALKELL